MGGQNVKLFLSCVSDEFGAYRDELRRKLTRPNVEVKIQEDFKLLGGDTLKMLEDYIAQCEAVVHFVGDMAGSSPAPTTVDDLLTRRPDLAARLADKGMGREALASLTYTQWEAWLAIGFGKDLIIVAPADGVARGPVFRPTDASRASEALNRKRLRAINRYPGPPFTGADNLVAQIFASAVIDALVKAAAKPAGQPRNLPFASIGRLFVGRDTALEALRAALASAPSKALSVRVINGLGGIGKTRLAIEYAWAHAGDYSALLFVRADGEAALNAGLAALAAAEILDLPEQEAREDAAKTEAVLRWLGAHPTWLLILDNVDDEQAVAAVGKLMPRLTGGHVIVTARASNFPAALPTLELDALDEMSATQFLIERTRGKRVEAADDETARLSAIAARARRPRARPRTGRRLYRQALHSLRTLSETLDREPREGARMVRRHADRLGKDARHDLGHVGRAAFARKARAPRPARHARVRPDPGCAVRRCGSRRSARVRRL